MNLDSIPEAASRQDQLYQEAAASYGTALGRLARGYEADPDRRRDLLQEIHLALWQSLAGFDARCSLRTWLYRVAHNVATSHVIREHRLNSRTMVGIEALETLPAKNDERDRDSSRESNIDRRHALAKLLLLIHQLKPLDRQIMLSYLEDMDAASIAEITGISPGNVATKIHRIKNVLTTKFHQGEDHGK